MVVFTQEYIASAPHAEVVITYPDGAVQTARVLADGNGKLVGDIRTAITSWGTRGRGSIVVELSRFLDKIRQLHADAFKRDPRRISSAWAVRS